MTDAEEAQVAASTSTTSTTPTDKDAAKSKQPCTLQLQKSLIVFIVLSLHSA